jgi:DNA-binding response OmpR family regulator
MAEKILVVDDDEPTRVGLAMLLAEAGYRTVTASSVPVGIRLLTDENPDLLLVDIRLDAYNGLHLVAMRPHPIPAVVLTGFADNAIEADARRLGAEFLLKPIAPQVLIALVARLLSDSKVGHAPPRRWPRKRVARDVRVDIDGAATARMLDVSYGGVCVEMHGTLASAPPQRFRIFVPSSDNAVPVETVWTRRRDDSTWLCGGMISDDAATSWRSVVDSLT